MDDDSDSEYINYSRSSSLITGLIIRLREMARKPEVDNNLGETLDIFMFQLKESEHYLSNGIVNLKFGEAGLFLQSSVELYGKKVDILWDNTVEYHELLTSCYRRDEEPTVESIRIREHMRKRGKRKNVLNKDLDVLRTSEVLETVIQRFERNNLLSAEAELCEELLQPLDISDTNCNPETEGCLEIRAALQALDFHKQLEIPCIYTVYQACIDDKLGHYDDFLTNNIHSAFDIYNNHVPAWSNIDQLNNNQNSRSGEHFPTNDQTRQLGLEKLPFVKIDKIPQNLMENFENDGQCLGGPHLLEYISRISETNQSQIRENDSDDHGYSSTSELFNNNSTPGSSIRRSNEDSGIFCSQVSNFTIREESDEMNDVACIAEHQGIPEGNEDVNLLTMVVEDGKSGAEVPPFAEILPLVEVLPATVVPLASPMAISLNSELNFTNMFLPLNSSTPRKVPVVKLERLTRKRLQQFDKSLNESPKQKRSRFRWLKTHVAPERDFENFHNQHYIPQLGEGDIPPFENDISDGDIDNDDIQGPEDAELEDSENLQFCRSIIIDIVDNLNVPNEEVVVVVPIELTAAVVQDPNVTDEHSQNRIEDAVAIIDRNCEVVLEQQVSSSLRTPNVMNDWREFINPIVEGAENRSRFNIHEYGTTLMNAIPNEKNLLFTDLVRGQPPGEVARFFMATLQLANTNNVELHNTCPGRLADHELELKLLTRDRYHEHLDQYEAPSEYTTREKLARIEALRNRPSTSQTMSVTQPVVVLETLSQSVLQSLQRQQQRQLKTYSKKRRTE